jgi:hypothetical protein
MLNKIIRQRIRELDNQANNNGYTTKKINRKSKVDLKSTNIFKYLEFNEK